MLIFCHIQPCFERKWWWIWKMIGKRITIIFLPSLDTAKWYCYYCSNSSICKVQFQKIQIIFRSGWVNKWIREFIISFTIWECIPVHETNAHEFQISNSDIYYCSVWVCLNQYGHFSKPGRKVFELLSITMLDDKCQQCCTIDRLQRIRVGFSVRGQGPYCSASLPALPMNFHNLCIQSSQ